MRHVSLWSTGTVPRTVFTAYLIALVIAGPLFAFQAPAGGSGSRDSRTMSKEMLVRISEIEVHSNYLEKYNAILKEEAEASVRLEAGVISIFPMYRKDKPTEIRILEIYAGREAYESHIKSPHFQKYKTATLKMVKSLKLVDMEALDARTMTYIFQKMTQR
jgi:quinol monooxygenase YgiN